MTFGQPSAFGSFGTGGFSGTGSGAARKPTNPFGTGAGFGASGGTGGSAAGGTSPWGAFSTGGGQGQQGGGQQQKRGGFEYAYNPADYPLTGPPPSLDPGRWHHDGSKWLDLWSLGGPRPSPYGPPAPRPTQTQLPSNPNQMIGGPGDQSWLRPYYSPDDPNYDWANMMILRDPNYAAPGTPATPTSPTSPTGLGMGTPESGWNMNPSGQYRETIPEGYMINPAFQQQQQNAQKTGMMTGVWHPYYIPDPNYVAPGTSPAPTPTSPTGPGTGTGTGTGYNWADLLGGMFGGGGGGRRAGLSLRNMSMQFGSQGSRVDAEQGLLDQLRSMGLMSQPTGDPTRGQANAYNPSLIQQNLPQLQQLGADYGVALPDFGNQANFSAANPESWSKAYGDWQRQLMRASAARRTAASAPPPAAVVPNTASTTGITLPFPA